jgi:hypothetical protein
MTDDKTLFHVLNNLTSSYTELLFANTLDNQTEELFKFDLVVDNTRFNQRFNCQKVHEE